MRRVLAAAAVGLAVIVAGLGGWRIGAGTAPAANSAAGPLTSASLLSATHQSVGQIFLYSGTSRWLYMSVDLEIGQRVRDLPGRRRGRAGDHDRVVPAGRRVRRVGQPEPGEPREARRGARLVSADGTVLATATFH